MCSFSIFNVNCLLCIEHSGLSVCLFTVGRLVALVEGVCLGVSTRPPVLRGKDQGAQRGEVCVGRMLFFRFFSTS